MAYTVKRGDTLWDLSRAYGVPLQELLRQVPESVRKDPRKLMPGMQFNIPGAQSPQAQSRQPRAQTYHREVPTLPEEGGRQTPPSRWETFKREAPDEAMKMLAGLPPSAAASGAGRGLSYLHGTAARNKHPLEAIGAGVQDAYYGAKNYLGNLYDKTSGFREAVRGHPTAAERRMVDDMFVTPNPVPTAAETAQANAAGRQLLRDADQAEMDLYRSRGPSDRIRNPANMRDPNIDWAQTIREIPTLEELYSAHGMGGSTVRPSPYRVTPKNPYPSLPPRDYPPYDIPQTLSLRNGLDRGQMRR